MTATANLKSGDALYYVSGRAGQNREVFVEKVGRKWITFVGEIFRADRATMRPEFSGFGRMGALYASEAEYRALVERQGAWMRLQKLVRERYAPPGHLTTEQITAVHEMIEKGGAV